MSFTVYWSDNNTVEQFNQSGNFFCGLSKLRRGFSVNVTLWSLTFNKIHVCKDLQQCADFLKQEDLHSIHVPVNKSLNTNLPNTRIPAVQYKIL